jgi:hypothetical protein
MKNLFNNLSEEEKKTILEQHYQNKENVDEQLGQRVKAGLQGAAQKVADVGKNIGSALTGGVNRAPDIDANHQKLQSWSKWLSDQLSTYKTNVESISKSTSSSKNATIPVYKGQVDMIVATAGNILALLPPLQNEANNIVKQKLPDPEKGAAPASGGSQTTPGVGAPAAQAGTGGTGLSRGF